MGILKISGLCAYTGILFRLLCVLRSLTHHRTHYVKTRRYPQNRKYITYRSADRGGPSHPRPQSACTENLVASSHVVFEICERKERQTDRQTDTHRLGHAHHNTSTVVLKRQTRSIWKMLGPFATASRHTPSVLILHCHSPGVATVDTTTKMSRSHSYSAGGVEQ